MSKVCESDHSGLKEKINPYPCLTLLHVKPVLVKLDNVGVFDLHQVLKHLLDLLLKTKKEVVIQSL